MTNVLLDVSDYGWDRHQVLPWCSHGSGERLPSAGFYESLGHDRPHDSNDDEVKAARRERERVRQGLA